MVVPHQGETVIRFRIPIKALKVAAILCAVFMLWMVGSFVEYKIATDRMAAEHNELEHLRQVNGTQVQQLQQLAQATAALQKDMNRLNALDADVQKLLTGEETTATSRVGLQRPTSQGTGGQGGPLQQPKPEELLRLVEDLQTSVKEREQSLVEAREALVARQARQAATPSIWPSSGDVTSRFGWRSSPWGGSGGDWHPGIDIADSYGAPIYATAEGEVVFSGWYGGYGQFILIDHGNGIATAYGHNSRNLVQVGDQVKKGQTIAQMGSTGNSTGPHVHYEVRVNGTQVNPAKFLQ